MEPVMPPTGCDDDFKPITSTHTHTHRVEIQDLDYGSLLENIFKTKPV